MLFTFDYQNPKHLALAFLGLAVLVTGIVLLARWADGSFPKLTEEEAAEQCQACVEANCPVDETQPMCTAITQVVTCAANGGKCDRSCKQLREYQPVDWWELQIALSAAGCPV
jgi:hypothetical protein